MESSASIAGFVRTRSSVLKGGSRKRWLGCFGSTTGILERLRGRKEDDMRLRFKVPKKFVVERKKWFRGDMSPGNSCLLLKENVSTLGSKKAKGKMCCVGFLARACGLRAQDIADRGTLLDVERSVKRCLSSEGFHKLVQLERGIRLKQVYSINDSVNMSERKREGTLTKAFKQLGIEVVFV